MAYLCKVEFLVFIGFLTVNKLGCGLLSSKLRKYFKSTSVFVV